MASKEEQMMKTFADRAREIMKKYDRFKDDPISIRSMERELEALAMEQEIYKIQNNIGQEEQQPVPQEEIPQEEVQGMPMEAEGMPVQMAGGGAISYSDPRNAGQLWNNINSPITALQLAGHNLAASAYPLKAPQNPYTNFTPSTQKENNTVINMGDLYSGRSVNQVSPTMVEPKYPQNPPPTLEQLQTRTDNTSLEIPSARKRDLKYTPDDEAKFNVLGGAASVGNVFQLIYDLKNKPTPTDYGRMNPELIDSTIQERNLRNAINMSANNMRGAMAESALTSGQRLASMSGLETVTRDKVGRGVGEIRERTDAHNAQTINRAREFNQQINMREVDADEQNKAARLNRIMQNINTIGSSFLSKPMAEKNKEQVVINQNKRLLELMNEGVLADYIMRVLKEGISIDPKKEEKAKK